MARLFALFHAGTGLLTRMIIVPLRSHEAAHVTALHAGDVLVGDRAFGTFTTSTAKDSMAFSACVQ